MRVLMFGGTTEARDLSRRLAAEGVSVTVCVATAYGAEEQGEAEGITVRTGRLDVRGMDALLREHAICIDATHPYAAEATRNIREACEKTGIPYRRVLRDAEVAEDAEGMVRVGSASEAATYLAEREGNILLTTGVKELAAFESIDPARVVVRTLPSHETLDACEKANIPHRNILAMQGPFTEELNAALLMQYDIAYLVTKDGGKTGGFPEKAAAARRAGVTLIVIERPQEVTRAYSAEELVRECREFMT